ncbi:MAG: 2-amino-3-carboxymuconate-6-semialdehyde decarboxylase [Verrucomicrobia bacterium]|nr:MAG: 2-amino-3-carboxymuconate-6-semialdehyde decarboxylase [Verrucomicrobiota bacterium]
MKIDLHTHILPRDWPDLDSKYGYPGFVRLDHYKPCCARMMIGDRVFREITDNVWDPQRRMEDMDGENVSMQVLSTVPVMFSYWAKPHDGLDLSRRLNDHLADVVRDHPKRFAGLATIPLQDPDLAATELERCVRKLGLHGAQIGTHVDANPHSRRIDTLNLDNVSLQPVWSAAEELNAAIFVHPWDMLGKERMPKYWLPWLVGMPAETSLAICSMIFGGVFERFPKLRVAFAHGGGAFPGTIGRIDHGFHVRPDLYAPDNDTNPRKYLASKNRKGELVPARFYVDSLVHDPDALRLLLNLFGPQRVALGSDYPFPLGEAHPGKLIESVKLSIKEKKQVLSETAREFLGLSAAA